MTGKTQAPLVAAAGLLGETAEAAQAAAMTLLRMEMEGLAVLFGGEGPARTEEALRAEAAATEEGFDNMPV